MVDLPFAPDADARYRVPFGTTLTAESALSSRMDRDRLLAGLSVVAVLATGVVATVARGSVAGIGTHAAATLLAAVTPVLALARRQWLALGGLLVVATATGVAWTLGQLGGAVHLLSGLAWCVATTFLVLETG